MAGRQSHLGRRPRTGGTGASHFENKECEVESREFKTITGTYQGKRITVVSTGIGCDNIDIVMNELDALAHIARRKAPSA